MVSKMTVRAARLIGMMLIIGVAGAGGCAAHFPKTDATMSSPQAQFNVPPRRLLEIVKQVVSSPPLGLSIQSEANGSILTSGQRFAGDWHVARRWQEQTMYRISVIPDFDSPDKSSLQVREFTQQRAAEGMKWENAAELQRPERSRQLLEKITEAVKAAVTSQPAAP
jgi:hypothetical protein